MGAGLQQTHRSAAVSVAMPSIMLHVHIDLSAPTYPHVTRLSLPRLPQLFPSIFEATEGAAGPFRPTTIQPSATPSRSASLSLPEIRLSALRSLTSILTVYGKLDCMGLGDRILFTICVQNYNSSGLCLWEVRDCVVRNH